MCDFIFVGKSNACPICHRLRDIANRNVYDLDPDLYNGPWLNVKMLIGRSHANFCVLAVAMFAMSVTVCEILTVEICMTLTVIFIIGQGQI